MRIIDLSSDVCASALSFTKGFQRRLNHQIVVLHTPENMKKTSILTGLAALLLVFQACNRTLEVEPLERITSEYLWDTDGSVGQFARQYLDHVYAALPDGHNRIGEIGRAHV